MGKLALLGAAGAIGQSIAAELRSRGESYRVVSRTRGSLERWFASDPLAESVTWDPSDAASIIAAAQDRETIVYLVGVDYTQFEQHPILMRARLDAAVTAGVQRMLLIGTVYPYGRPQTNPVREDHPRAPRTFKGRKRKEQEDLLLDADRRGDIQGTVLRLPDFYVPGVTSSFLSELFVKGAVGKTASLIGPIDTPHEYVYVPDSVRLLLR